MQTIQGKFKDYGEGLDLSVSEYRRVRTRTPSLRSYLIYQGKNRPILIKPECYQEFDMDFRASEEYQRIVTVKNLTKLRDYTRKMKISKTRQREILKANPHLREHIIDLGQGYPLLIRRGRKKIFDSEFRNTPEYKKNMVKGIKFKNLRKSSNGKNRIKTSYHQRERILKEKPELKDLLVKGEKDSDVIPRSKIPEFMEILKSSEEYGKIQHNTIIGFDKYMKRYGLGKHARYRILKENPAIKECLIIRGSGYPYLIKPGYETRLDQEVQKTKIFGNKQIKISSVAQKTGLTGKEIKLILKNHPCLGRFFVRSGNERKENTIRRKNLEGMQKAIRETNSYRQLQNEREKAENKPTIMETTPMGRRYMYKENGRFPIRSTDNWISGKFAVMKLKKIIDHYASDDEWPVLGELLLMGAEEGFAVRAHGDVFDVYVVKDFFSEMEVSSIKNWFMENVNGNGTQVLKDLFKKEVSDYLKNKYPQLFVTEEPKTRQWSEIPAGYGGRGPRNEREAARLDTKHKEELVKLGDKELDENPDY